MSISKIVLNTIYYGVIPKLSMLISIVILPLTTPFLTTYDYGITGIVSSYTSFISCIAPLGLNLYLTNSFYEVPNRYNLVWGRVLFCFIISGIIFGLISIFVLYIALSNLSIWESIFVAILGSLPVFLFANNILAQHLFPLLGKPLPLVLTNLTASCLSILISFILIYFLKLGYWGMLIGSSVSCIVTYVAFVKQIWFKYNIYPIIKLKYKRKLLEKNVKFFKMILLKRKE